VAYNSNRLAIVAIFDIVGIVDIVVPVFWLKLVVRVSSFLKYLNFNIEWLIFFTLLDCWKC